jgi:Ni,Fe-hydrogenase I cytochrome b subunit
MNAVQSSLREIYDGKAKMERVFFGIFRVVNNTLLVSDVGCFCPRRLFSVSVRFNCVCVHIYASIFSEIEESNSVISSMR